MNGEFDVAPPFNELIESGRRIITYPVTELHELGTSEDLEAFKRLKLLA